MKSFQSSSVFFDKQQTVLSRSLRTILYSLYMSKIFLATFNHTKFHLGDGEGGVRGRDWPRLAERVGGVLAVLIALCLTI